MSTDVAGVPDVSGVSDVAGVLVGIALETGVSPLAAAALASDCAGLDAIVDPNKQS
jgi:hypothetical protein